jgi:magnesium-protoporphyrin O-methyltransferase
MQCCDTGAGTDRYFSKYSKRYAKRFRKKGPDKPSRILIEELFALNISAGTVLDVGCGAGDVHLSLLEHGVATAVAVDISRGMLDQAAALAKERGLGDRVSYVHGDLIDVAGTIDPAEIVVLDKVVCCYADPETLLRMSGEKAKQFLALSYPGGSWLSACSFRFLDLLGRALRWSFHPYYHDPSELERIVQHLGFSEKFSGRTIMWKLKIYARA